jgi:cytochrome c
MHRLLYPTGLILLSLLFVTLIAACSDSSSATTPGSEPADSVDSRAINAQHTESPVAFNGDADSTETPTVSPDEEGNSDGVVAVSNENEPTMPPTPTLTDEEVEQIKALGDPEQGNIMFHNQWKSPPKGFVACKTCHHTDPTLGVLIGPNMHGIADRAGTRIPDISAVDYLRASIERHDEYIVEGFEEGVMIGIVGDDFENILEPQHIDDMVAYLLTLKGGEEEVPAQDIAQVEATPAPGDDVSFEDGARVRVGDEFTFQPIEGWHTGMFTDTVITRPEDAGFQSGPVVAIRTDLISNLNIPNEDTESITITQEFLDLMFTNFEEETGDVTLSDVQEREIAGAPGRIATFEGFGFGDIETDDVAGQLVVAKVDELHTFVMMGLATPPDEWDIADEFETILQSVEFIGSIGGVSHVPPVSSYKNPGQVQGGDHTTYHDHVVYAPAANSDDAAALKVLAMWEAEHIQQHSGEIHYEIDRDSGARFSCVHCHVTHEVEMLHDSNPSCDTCHSGTPYQRHCVDCHSIHSVKIPHEPDNPGCEGCHVQGIPTPGVDVQKTLVTFFSYLFHEI